MDSLSAAREAVHRLLAPSPSLHTVQALVVLGRRCQALQGGSMQGVLRQIAWPVFILGVGGLADGCGRFYRSFGEVVQEAPTQVHILCVIH